MSARALKPRPELAVAPLGVSQLTCAAVLGVDPRRFLELVVPHCRNVAHVGKLRVVAVEEVQRVLRELGAGPVEAAGEPSGAVANDDATAAPLSGDGVLARLGLQRTAGHR